MIDLAPKTPLFSAPHTSLLTTYTRVQAPKAGRFIPPARMRTRTCRYRFKQWGKRKRQAHDQCAAGCRWGRGEGVRDNYKCFEVVFIVSPGFCPDLRTLFVAEGLLMSVAVSSSSYCDKLSHYAQRYLSKASVISILDQIAKTGRGNCIVCDTVCAPSLLCREKWHGHFSWGINFEVYRSSHMHMHRGGLYMNVCVTSWQFASSARYCYTLPSTPNSTIIFSNHCVTGNRSFLRCEALARVLGGAVVSRAASRRVVWKARSDFKTENQCCSARAG
jgi:hypothetical protein